MNGQRMEGFSFMDQKDLEEWITPADVSEKYNIPVETIRRYLRQHGHHLKIKKIHKKYLIHSDSVKFIPQIRDQFADGKSVEEVEEYLESKGLPLTITVQPDEHERHDRDDRLEGAMLEMAKKMDQFQSQFNQQKEFNRQLVDRLDQQQKYIDERMNERDRLLMESLRGIQEQNKLIAATQEEEKKKGFWKRLFGK